MLNYQRGCLKSMKTSYPIYIYIYQMECLEFLEIEYLFFLQKSHFRDVWVRHLALVKLDLPKPPQNVWKTNYQYGYKKVYLGNDSRDTDGDLHCASRNILAIILANLGYSWPTKSIHSPTIRNSTACNSSVPFSPSLGSVEKTACFSFLLVGWWRFPWVMSESQTS